MNDTRYQHQPWYIKTYRWLRWRPWYWVKVWFVITGWAIRGAKPLRWGEGENAFGFDRWHSIEHFLIMYKGLAECKMQHYYTTEEVFGISLDTEETEGIL